MEKYINHDDWETVDWPNLVFFLDRFKPSNTSTPRPVATTLESTTYSEFSTSAWRTTALSLQTLDDSWQFQNISLQEHIQDLFRQEDFCPSKEFARFKILARMVYQYYATEWMYGWKYRSFSFRSTNFEKLSSGIMAYRDLLWDPNNLWKASEVKISIYPGKHIRIFHFHPRNK